MLANGLQGWHLIILVAVVVLLFGAKRLPDAARSLGKSMRIFKSEIKEMKSDEPGSDARPTSIASERVDPAPSANPDPSTATAEPSSDKHPA
jgi:sec-independent protein translocase protein TatA